MTTRAQDETVVTPWPLARRMVAEGRLGRKSGQGFYEWSER